MTDILTINFALAMDAVTLIICVTIASRIANTVLHPAYAFLCWHLYIVTLRLVQLEAGFMPMAYPFAWPVSLEEVARAAIASDWGLLAMTLGWVIGARTRSQRKSPARQPRSVSFRRVRVAASVALALGIGSLLVLGKGTIRSSGTFASWGTSGYVVAAAAWSPWALCLLHYIYGFPPPLTAMTGMVLAVLMLFNGSRMVVLLPSIMLLLIWIVKKGRKTVPLALAPVGLLVWLIWLPMKPFFYSLQDGATLPEAIDVAYNRTFRNFGEDQGSGIDFEFLDMIASTMTLVDIHGQWFYGGTFIPLLVSPAPRHLWHDKPHMNQFQLDIDIPERNMGQSGMTAGLVGEAYANGGWIGIGIVLFTVGLLSTKAFYRATESRELSPELLLYLLCLATSMQVYRDGLISLVWFPFVYGAPIGWTALSHWVWQPTRCERRIMPTALAGVPQGSGA